MTRVAEQTVVGLGPTAPWSCVVEVGQQWATPLGRVVVVRSVEQSLVERFDAVVCFLGETIRTSARTMCSPVGWTRLPPEPPVPPAVEPDTEDGDDTAVWGAT